MYAHSEKKRSRRLHQNPSQVEYRGMNRRLSSLLPDEQFAAARLRLTAKTSILQQLLNIEAQQLTCCVKIDAPRFKSRAGLLIIRGKVLACVYGNKYLPQQLFGKVAYGELMAEIGHRDNIFDAYIVPEDIVLAAGSMFHNQINIDMNSAARNDNLNSILDQFDKHNGAGTIALFDHRSPLCLAYFSKRKLIGSQSILDGISLADMDAVLKYLNNHPEAHLLGSMLNLERYNLLKDFSLLTFSLSGLQDETRSTLHADSVFAATGLVLLQSVKPQSCKLIPPPTQFITGCRQRNSISRPSVPDTHPFKVYSAYPCYVTSETVL